MERIFFRWTCAILQPVKAAKIYRIKYMMVHSAVLFSFCLGNIPFWFEIFHILVHIPLRTHIGFSVFKKINTAKILSRKKSPSI